jgi:hypothetical protein
MGKSNPNGRGYATAYNSKIINQFTAGGNKKAGVGTHIGMGPFVYAAIVNGAAGHPAPTVSGRSWLTVMKSQYPVPNVNQIGGIGRPRWGMFNPSADGVNIAALNAGRARIAAGPPGWGLVFA